MDDLIEWCANNNLFDDNNLVHIHNNIKIDIKSMSNPDKNMTGGNLYNKNFEINIKDLF